MLAISKTAAEKGVENCFQGCRPDKIIPQVFVKGSVNRTPTHTGREGGQTLALGVKVGGEDFEESEQSSI